MGKLIEGAETQTMDSTANSATPRCRLCRGSGVRVTLAGSRRCRCSPAPKQVRGPRAATHEGECGVCERSFSVDRESERLALHGFARPGHGWLVGQCPGQDRLPVERSKETIELLRELATSSAERAAAKLVELRAPEIQELPYQHRRPGSYNLPRTASFNELFEIVTIRRGDDADYRRGLPSFDDLLARRIRQVEIEEQQARELVKRAEDRLVAWEPKDLRVR